MKKPVIRSQSVENKEDRLMRKENRWMCKKNRWMHKENRWMLNEKYKQWTVPAWLKYMLLVPSLKPVILSVIVSIYVLLMVCVVKTIKLERRYIFVEFIHFFSRLSFRVGWHKWFQLGNYMKKHFSIIESF